MQSQIVVQKTYETFLVSRGVNREVLPNDVHDNPVT